MFFCCKMTIYQIKNFENLCVFPQNYLTASRFFGTIYFNKKLIKHGLKKGTDMADKNKKSKKQQNPFISDGQLASFGRGENFSGYDFLGAHPAEIYAESGYSFAVWAPNAQSVSVVGDFNGWDIDANVMNPQGSSGVWHCFIKGVHELQCYKYYIKAKDGSAFYKADPYAFFAQVRPETASVTYDINGFKWSDEKWIGERRSTAPYDKPMLIYEMHLGSWKRHEDGSFYTYRETADELVDYLCEMNYTHVELMPVTEYPFDGSWGYQVTGYFAATSRYGKPKDFMYFVNKCHRRGISVIVDWVPAHFPRDAHGLARFDGTAVYEYANPAKGEHKEWGTYVFDYGRPEVVSFLISSAMFWMDKFHIDGIRVDAVSSMLYLDYGRTEWIPNKYGGRENLEAIEFFKKLNAAVFEKYPNVLMIAEESTAWPLVTKPVRDGGLGFNYKWNMGWMNDMLRYMSMDPYFRRGNHNILTFSMMYAFSENYILPLSHDEVVHGKGSLIQKMSGLYGQKFESLKTFFMYQMAHPGKKLLFMGGEIAQFIEWRYYESLEWHLLNQDRHRKFREFMRCLNEFYVKNKAFWEIEDSWDGFEWINPDDCDRSVISFVRRGRKKRDEVVVVCNFTPVRYNKYVLGAPSAGNYAEVFSTNDSEYGGNGRERKSYRAKKGAFRSMPYTLEIDLEPMSAVYLKRTSPAKKKQGGDK